MYKYVRLFILILLIAVLPVFASFSIPQSNRVIEGEVQVLAGKEVKCGASFGIRDGVLLTIESGPEKYGFIPVIQDNSGSAKISSFFIKTDSNGNERIEQLAGASGQVKTGDAMLVSGKINIKISGFHESRFQTKPTLSGTPSELKQIYGNEICCVTCKDEVKVCASQVKMSCGRCSVYSPEEI